VAPVRCAPRLLFLRADGKDGEAGGPAGGGGNSAGFIFGAGPWRIKWLRVASCRQSRPSSLPVSSPCERRRRGDDDDFGCIFDISGGFPVSAGVGTGRFLLRFSGGNGRFGNTSGNGRSEFVLVLLLGKEWSPVSFPFRVGNCVAGCGIASFFFAVVAGWFFVCVRVDLWDYGAAEEGGGGAKAEVPTAGFSSRGWFAASLCAESALCFGLGKVGGWVSRSDARCAAEARQCRQWRKTNSVSGGLFVIFVTSRGLSARKDVLCLILS